MTHPGERNIVMILTPSSPAAKWRPSAPDARDPGSANRTDIDIHTDSGAGRTPPCSHAHDIGDR